MNFINNIYFILTKSRHQINIIPQRTNFIYSVITSSIYLNNIVVI